MIRSKDLIPEVYNTSLDFKVFEAVLDILFSDADIKCSKLQGLHSPRQCFDENLGKLSELFDLLTSDRQLLKNYRLMLKSKGTQPSIEAALQFCGAKIIKNLPNDMQNPTISSLDDSSLGDKILCTYYVIFKNFNAKLFFKLRKMLFPANMQFRLLPISSLDETLDINEIDV